MRQRLGANRAILANASAMAGTTIVGSSLGFLYWWLAARYFPPTAVGFAAAGISAMVLLGNIGVLGFGTLLMGELPRRPGRERSLISTVLFIVAAAGGLFGLAWALLAPRLAPDFQPLAASLASVGLFAAGVSLTAAGQVIDSALIGLLRGGFQLGRNILFNAVKLLALWCVGAWTASRLGMTIYATWAAGNLLSLAFLGSIALMSGDKFAAYRPDWRMVRGLGRAALGHHALNLALQTSSQLMPVVVTIVLTAAVNASFYVAWMIATTVFIGPAALTTVLYAASAATPDALRQKSRFTLGCALAAGLIGYIALLLGADLVLGIFGRLYADQAATSLRILGLAVFPLIIKDHFVAVSRVHGRVIGPALLMGAGGLLELGLAAAGGTIGGLPGLSLGWLLAVCAEAVIMAPVVYRAAGPVAALRPARRLS